MVGARIIGSVLIDVEIDALVQNVTVNGVDVGAARRGRARPPAPRADRPAADRRGRRRSPRSTSSTRFWEPTLARVRRLPEAVRHARVADEWSTVETLRHLLLVYDAWFGRAVLGEAAPYHPLGLPASFMDAAELGLDIAGPAARRSTTCSPPGRRGRTRSASTWPRLDDEALRGRSRRTASAASRPRRSARRSTASA